MMIIVLPCSITLTYLWNLGSFLGLTLMIQVISGLLLLLNYNTLESYNSIIFIVNDVEIGWLMKILHSNNASVIFLLLYLHLFKNFSVWGYRLIKTWCRGILMILLIIGAAFTGYVLVGSQIRFWAAIVITSLVGVVPLIGESLLYLIWGGYRINWLTYQTLLVLHFILPFIVLGIMLMHLIFLHDTGRSDSSMSHFGISKISFYPYYVIKDIINLPFYLFFAFLFFSYPYFLGEVELFEEANPLNSPLHILPEWYFCAQYAILRRVPSKPAGVLLMFFSIVIYLAHPVFCSYTTPASNISNSVWIILIGIQIWLSYLGSAPIAIPFILVAALTVLLYFFFHLSLIVLNYFSFLFYSLS